MAELIDPSNYQDFTLEMLRTPDGITKLNSILRQLSQNISGDTETVRVYSGVGTPEASVAAGIGSLYMRTDGGSDTSVYRKESGSGDTGWVAVKSPANLPLSVANGGFGSDNSAIPQGYIPYMSATGVISWLPVGTSGQYLKTLGSGANPTWSTLTVPVGYNLVSITNISGAAASANISITNTKMYFVRIVLTGDSGGGSLELQFNGDTTSGNYKYSYAGYTTASSTLTESHSNSTTSILLTTSGTPDTVTNHYIDFNIYPQGTTGSKTLGISGTSTNNLDLNFLQVYGRWAGSADATYFNIFKSGGATITGKVYLYELTIS